MTGVGMDTGGVVGEGAAGAVVGAGVGSAWLPRHATKSAEARTPAVVLRKRRLVQIRMFLLLHVVPLSRDALEYWFRD